MAAGLIAGLVALGLKGVGTVGNAVEDSKAKQRTNDGITYSDHKGKIYDSKTGRQCVVRYLDQYDVEREPYKSAGCQIGDCVVYDLLSGKIIENRTAKLRPEREAKAKERIEKTYNLIERKVQMEMVAEKEYKKLRERQIEIDNEVLYNNETEDEIKAHNEEYKKILDRRDEIHKNFWDEYVRLGGIDFYEYQKKFGFKKTPNYRSYDFDRSRLEELRRARDEQR